MQLVTAPYSVVIDELPATGQHIVAHQTAAEIVVYQAYQPAIAEFAVTNQYLGGSHFSYSRMSWIKPNFLWMMYRCGWAEKTGQERVLALWLRKTDFDAILDEAVYSSFQPRYYQTHEQWRHELDHKEIRLQWDPDHDPYGKKQERRAIQLGLKGDMLAAFGKSFVLQIDDITGFVREQKRALDAGRLADLQIPVETVYRTSDEALNTRIGLSI